MNQGEGAFAGPEQSASSPAIAPEEGELADGYFRGGLAGHFFPELDDWRTILETLGVSLETAVALAAQANVNGTGFQSELIASGKVTERDLYAAISADFGVPFLETFNAQRLIIRDSDCITLLQHRGAYRFIKIEERGGQTSYLLAPDGIGLARLRDIVERRPSVAARLKFTTPSMLRSALLRRARHLLMREATNGLFDLSPDFSARIVATAWQGTVLGSGLVAVMLAVVVVPDVAYTFLHVSFSFFFLACVWLRFAAIRSPQRPREPATGPMPVADMPHYSVLVALHREAEVVPQLLAALDALVWPRGKLEIKLVCEADDAETLAAIRACPLPPHVEIIEVPPGRPRTKPKALAFALPTTRGEYVVLYDAEDRPHPRQLLEAWRRFAASPLDLACVQAPLEIANGDRSAIARMFAFEYAALFRGLLPWLSARRLLLPLGGTSNHFRVSSLEEVGGWDPYNVTEDADLGIRLARYGYRTETISLPTLEDGPENLDIWLPQRTRWFKGWAQTWLVHMRDPVALLGELGFRSFAIAQILFAGLLLSALVHPLLVGTAIYLAVEIAIGKPMSVWQSAMLVVDLTNIACGYLSFLLLGWQALTRAERKGFWKVVLFTPVYWLMMSAAAWRSLWHLWRRPHHWEKTPHYRMRGRG